ncbi:MAG: mechanosensitive ion channel family protein [Bacilli bacterium]|nr:mechanosensitive ion channel family protein [Bacilli bacterium]
MHFLFSSTPVNIVVTIAISIVVITLFVLERIFIKKREETIKKWVLFLLFLASLVVFVGAALGIMLVWNLDISTFASQYWTDIVAFFTASVPALIGTAITLFVWFVILRIAKITLKRLGDKPGALQKRRKTISKVMYSIINYSIAIIGIIVILAIWGANVLPALAGLGILGLVIGLGAQKFIQDLIAGFFIIFEHHFDVGDVIEVAGFKGTVIDIGLKTTKLRNWRGDIKIFNNGEVNTLTNYSKNPSIAVVEFSIAYKEDINKAMDVLKAAFPLFRDQYKDVLLEDVNIVGVIALTARSVDLRVTVKTLNEQHYGIERALRKFIKETLDANEIEIPFPQVVVHKSE